MRAVIRPRYRARHDHNRVDFALRHNLIDLRFSLSEQTDGIAGGLESALRTLLIGGRLLQVFLGYAFGLIEFFGARQGFSGQLEHCGGCDQGRLGLTEVRAVYRIELLAFGHFIAQFCKQADDFPLVGGKDLDRHVLVEVDTADRFALNNESAFSNLLDLDRFGLCLVQLDCFRGSSIPPAHPRRLRCPAPVLAGGPNVPKGTRRP